MNSETVNVAEPTPSPTKAKAKKPQLSKEEKELQDLKEALRVANLRKTGAEWEVARKLELFQRKSTVPQNAQKRMRKLQNAQDSLKHHEENIVTLERLVAEAEQKTNKDQKPAEKSAPKGKSTAAGTLTSLTPAAEEETEETKDDGSST